MDYVLRSCSLKHAFILNWPVVKVSKITSLALFCLLFRIILKTKNKKQEYVTHYKKTDHIVFFKKEKLPTSVHLVALELQFAVLL